MASGDLRRVSKGYLGCGTSTGLLQGLLVLRKALGGGVSEGCEGQGPGVGRRMVFRAMRPSQSLTTEPREVERAPTHPRNLDGREQL